MYHPEQLARPFVFRPEVVAVAENGIWCLPRRAAPLLVAVAEPEDGVLKRPFVPRGSFQIGEGLRLGIEQLGQRKQDAPQVHEPYGRGKRGMQAGVEGGDIDDHRLHGRLTQVLSPGPHPMGIGVHEFLRSRQYAAPATWLHDLRLSSFPRPTSRKSDSDFGQRGRLEL